MSYKQQKYQQQKFTVNKIISSSNYIGLFQIKSGDISYWLHIKKILNISNISIKFCSIKLLKQTKLYSLFSGNLENIYNGKIVILYSNNKLPSIHNLSKDFFISIKTIINNRLILDYEIIPQNNYHLDLIMLLGKISYTPCQPNAYNNKL